MRLPKKLFFLAIFFALVSSLRIPFLPEFELLILVIYTIKRRGIDYNVLILLFLILCTHHFAIPDALYREDASAYPSIYTKKIGPLKALDWLVLYLSLLSIKRVLFLKKILLINHLPTILLITSLFGFIFSFRLHIADDLILYIIRSYLLIFVLFVNIVNLKKDSLIQLSYLAIVCWLSKMVFAILIPHPNPWYRAQFGFEGIIYFAGDEYMFIPVYLAIIIYYCRDRISFIRVQQIIYLALVLALISQRKGSIPIFLSFSLLIYLFQRPHLRFYSNCYKLYLVFSSALMSIFLIFEEQLIQDELINLAFLEYHTLAQVSLDSVTSLIRSDFWSACWGITPWGKYEIIGLPAFLDDFMTWGNEIGEKYRYQLWSFPFGRCVLNSGLFGLLICFFYYVKSLSYSLPVCFIAISAFGLCYYGNLTPVNSISIGLSAAFLYNIKYDESRNE